MSDYKTLKKQADECRADARQAMRNVLHNVFDTPKCVGRSVTNGIADRLVDDIVSCAMLEVAASFKLMAENGDPPS